MPHRIIPWRVVATELGGRAEVKTSHRSSSFSLRATVEDFSIEVVGQSVPYSTLGGSTTIRVRSPSSFHGWLSVARDRIGGPLLKRLLFIRDVELGDALFDIAWLIRSHNDAFAQAMLGPTIARAIQNVPYRRIPQGTDLGPIDGPIDLYYEFETRGRIAQARTRGFEDDSERLMAAIQASVVLARQPENLLEDWRTLARELEGQLEYSGRWKMDGSTRIAFPMLGKRLVLMPLACKTQRRVQRLRTRLLAERPRAEGLRLQLIHRRQISAPRASRRLAELSLQGKSAELLKSYNVFCDNAEQARTLLSVPIAEALHRAQAALVDLHQSRLHIDFDGSVTDSQRLIAAGSAAAGLVRGEDEGAGPYR